MLFLLNRLDKSAEEAFSDYHKSEDSLDYDKIKKMSKITQFIMSSIGYKSVADRRISNYTYLHDNLGSSNTLSVDLERKNVPMVYPFLSDDINLRKKLIDNKVYVASYWPNVKNMSNLESVESQFAVSLIPIPIDQRYGKDNLNKILEIIGR